MHESRESEMIEKIKHAVLSIGLIATFLAVGIWLGPTLRMAHDRWFPEPEFITGDYSDLLTKAGKQVVMYSTSTCPHCKHAREFLEKEHVAYQDYIVDQSPEVEAQFKSLGGSNVPLIFIGHRRITGFTENTVRESLAQLGH